MQTMISPTRNHHLFSSYLLHSTSTATIVAPLISLSGSGMDQGFVFINGGGGFATKVGSFDKEGGAGDNKEKSQRLRHGEDAHGDLGVW